MFAERLASAIDDARPSQIDDLARTLWKAHAAALVTDEDAERLAAAIEARRTIGKVTASKPAPRRVGSRPKSEASLQRRRRWVAAGLMPPQIACEFTAGEAAALAVVAREIAKRRVCSLAIGAIAALAGVGETTVRNALRRAKALGLLSVRERRLTRWRNATNIVSIVSAEWRTWLRLGDVGASGGRVQNRVGHDFDSSNRPVFAPFAGSMSRGRDRFGSPSESGRGAPVVGSGLRRNARPAPAVGRFEP